MTPGHTQGVRLYRYYVSGDLLKHDGIPCTVQPYQRSRSSTSFDVRASIEKRCELARAFPSTASLSSRVK
jgi:hypothetical protein